MPEMITKDHLSEPAILQAEMIVRWKKERGFYNFKALPKKAIITTTRAISPGVFHKKISGLGCRAFIKENYLHCNGLNTGAHGLVMLLEELRALGVQEFIFLGLSGAIAEGISPGDVFCIDQALSGSGITAYYHPEKMIAPYNKEHVNNLRTTLNIPFATCFSTDAPFRETASLITMIKERGCSLIEMECAAAYAFAQFYHLKVTCLLVAADTLTNGWVPPADMKYLLSVQKSILNTITKHHL